MRIGKFRNKLYFPFSLKIFLKKQTKMADCTLLKKKMENNSTWEGAIFLDEWVKINSNWIIFILRIAAANVSKFFCVARKQIMNAFYIILTFHFKYQILYACKLASLKWRKSKKVENFLSKMREINSRLVIFNL